MIAKVLIFGAVLAFAIGTAWGSLSGAWRDDLRARCVAAGGQVIEMVSKVQAGCLLPPGVPSLAPESP